MTRKRLWFALCQYPGKDEFYFGTVEADDYEHARRRLIGAWAEVSPYPPPDRMEPTPGQIIVQPD